MAKIHDGQGRKWINRYFVELQTAKVAEPEFAHCFPSMFPNGKGETYATCRLTMWVTSACFFGSKANMAVHRGWHVTTTLRSQHWRIPDLWERCLVLTGGFLAEGFDIDGFASWRGFLMVFLVFCAFQIFASVFWVFTCLQERFSFCLFLLFTIS